MKTQQIIEIKGTYTGTDNDGRFNWICPFTELHRTAWGEFGMDENFIHYHDMRDEDGNLLYVVTE